MPTSSRSLRRSGVRLLVSLVALIGAVAAAEVGLAVFLPQPVSWLSVYEEDEVLPYRLRAFAEQLVDTGETSWLVSVDAQGYRHEPGTSPDEELPFWLGLGDSFAFGHGVDQGQSLYACLERELGPGFTIRNAAVPGYGPAQYRSVLERHLDEPALRGVLLASFLGNDFFDCIWDKEGPITAGALGASTGRRYWLKSHSHLYRFLSARAHLAEVGRGETDLGLNARLVTREAWSRPPLAPAREVFRRELARMGELCRSRELPLLVLLLPARASVDEELLRSSLAEAALPQGSWERDLPTAVALSICEELGLPCADPSELLRSLPGPLYFRFDGHFRPETTSALARWFAPWLRDRAGSASGSGQSP